MRGRDNRRVKEDGQQLDKHVDVEEQNNLLSAHCRVLGTYMEEHDKSHSQSSNVNKARC